LISLTLLSTSINLNGGDGWCIDGNIEHGVEVLEDSIVIEVFSPPREDYLNL
jgi:hypothetical protein